LRCRVVMSRWAAGLSCMSPSEITASIRRVRPWRRLSSWSASLTASGKVVVPPPGACQQICVTDEKSIR
jgi:hypothetical protein